MTDTSIVICVEDNHIAPQACLLAASLRRFGGDCANQEILAVSPRKKFHISQKQRDQLNAHGVQVIEEDLNNQFHDYPQANKIFACLWAEHNLSASYVAFVDSDSLFLNPPTTLLSPSYLCAARPVWFSGIGTAGNHDPAERLWVTASRTCQTELSTKMTTTAVSGEQIRRYYNTGFICYRRDMCIAEQWLNCYSLLATSDSVRKYLYAPQKCQFPAMATPNFFLDQLAFAMALDRSGILEVDELDCMYNVAVDQLDRLSSTVQLKDVVQLHYLRYFQDPFTAARILELFKTDPERRAWISDWLPLEPILHLEWPSTFHQRFEQAMLCWREELQDADA